jgi:WD40 repeat protein
MPKKRDSTRARQPVKQQELKPPPGVKLLRTLEGHEDVVYGIAFDPAGRTLASGSGDNTVRLWDVASGKLLRALEGHTNSVYAIAFDVDEQLLASMSGDGTLCLWSCDTWEMVAVISERVSLYMACRYRF